jgi:SAM-dependent methyltransferase
MPKSIEVFFDQLIELAAKPYRSAGQTPYHFARGKLRQDPVFFALLAQGLLPSAGELTDLGCGQGSLIAILLAARAMHAEGKWPTNWPPPPRLSMHGVDLRPAAIRAANIAFGGQARVEQGDIRTAPIPPSDVIAILDVLHYIDAGDQQRVLARCHASLRPGGLLVLRVGDASAGWRFFVTTLGDRLITMLRGTLFPRFHCRPLTEWISLVTAIGFEVTAQPMSEGTPFANVLLIARKR